MKTKSNLVKDSVRLRKAIIASMRIKKISNRSLALKTDLPESSISRYLSRGNVIGSLSEENVLKVCKRLKIDVKLIINHKS